MSTHYPQQIITALQQTFRYFGLPDEIVCDNGRQFISQPFRDFLHAHHIDLRLTPPYHSQSNGKVERSIRTFKLFLNKNLKQGKLKQLVSWFCMMTNFFPNSNGLVPCREYLSTNPRVMMTKILLSDKRGVTESQAPTVLSGSSVVPLADNRRAHAGGVVRLRQPNSRYFNNDFVTS